jgi:hypothetical protein
VVSAGKLVRDEDGNAVMVRRFSDTLLLALLRARRPARFSKGLPAVLAIGSTAAPFDVRAMLLEKLALLASHTEPEMPPLIEGGSREDAVDEAEAAGDEAEAAGAR